MNKNFHNAKKAKNDEFYTLYEDIEKEVIHYKDQLKNKTIYCNCDDPRESNFFKYFYKNFEALELKGLIVSCYKQNKPAVYVEYDKTNLNEPIKTQLKEFTGDGDFRSEESIALLNKSDIVVSNPPFSLFREYVNQLIEHDKQFLIIGSYGAITYKEIFKLIKNNKLKLGINKRGMDFKTEKGETRNINASWFTNLETINKKKQLKLERVYKKEDYEKYDNYDAININRLKDIPKDYEGVMGVPITFLEKHNPLQFEIIKFRKGNDNKDLSINKKELYFRILIKRIKKATK